MGTQPAGRTRARAGRSPMPTIAVLGVGQMGLVCAGVLAERARQWGHDAIPAGVVPWASQGAGDGWRVVLWGHNPDETAKLAQTRRSDRLPGFAVPESVRVAWREGDVVPEADLIVSAIPVQHMRAVWSRLVPLVRRDAAVVSVAKGIEAGTLMRPTQVIADVLRDDPDARPRRMGVLSGPTIAAELARCLPATMIAASDDPDFARALQHTFATNWLRIYTNADVLGVELAGATKHVIAIAAGILDGLQAGYNAKSALLARGLAEITRLGVAVGASPETFFGIAGVGDLATSCFCPQGRNRSCGEALGRGETLETYLARVRHVVEGVATTRAVLDLSRKYRVEMPITAAVHAVLFEGIDPLDAIGRLMARELKGERVG